MFEHTVPCVVFSFTSPFPHIKSMPGAESVIWRWHVGTPLFPLAICSLAVEETCKYVRAATHYPPDSGVSVFSLQIYFLQTYLQPKN